MTKAAFLFSAEAAGAYGESALGRLRLRAEILGRVTPAEDWPRHRDWLGATEVIFSGWGAPTMDAEFLQAVPRLKAVFYAGGSVRYFTSEAFWERGVRLTAAHALNAIPASEYAVGAILLGLKRFWHYARLTRERRSFPGDRPAPGAYGSKIGLVSYGTIARMVRQKLREHDLNFQVYDPFLSPEEARRENVRLVTLEELFADADVVSVHTPLLAETTGLIRGRHFERLRPGAVFINTARGEIVNEPEMVACLQHRPDVQAVLDVTAPEPPAAGSPLYTLPNVVLTPHIAGSIGPECQRMGHAMVDEFERFLDGRPLLWEINPERCALMA